MLKVFEKASGQKVNIQKSSVFFSRNIFGVAKQDIYNVLQFPEADDNTLYLGLPNLIGRKKSVIMGYLKDRLQSRVEGWDNNFFQKELRKFC